MHGVVAGVRPEVTRYATAQALGLADVEHLACRALPEIHSRLVRQRRQFAGDQPRNFHSRRASGWRSTRVRLPYTTAKIATVTTASGIGGHSATASVASAPAPLAPAAAASEVPKPSQSTPRITVPIRLSRCRRWSTTLTQPPIEDPSAIPATPNRRINRWASTLGSPVETAG